MEHYATHVLHDLLTEDAAYSSYCSCGFYCLGSTESSALTQLDDHILATRTQDSHSVRV